ncbi:Mitochondrial substrate carrier family protein ucpB [Diplonema papillatum]|nr:Mitochondrial substrate carrier family protein ucpB [Diplonema papillatum]
MSSDFYYGALCGGLGGVAGQVLTNPVDIVKIRLQLDRSVGGRLNKKTGWHVFREEIRTNGSKGLCRGLTVAASHQFVYSSVRLQTYEVIKERLGDDPSFYSRMLLAALCGVLATVASNPLERCKVVIQALPKERCPSFPSLLRVFSGNSAENLVASIKGQPRTRPQGLMGGIGASAQRSAIVHAVQLSVYDSLRDVSDTLLKLHPTASLVLASILSGFISAAVGAPLDVVKTRLMAGQGGDLAFKGIADCVVRTVREEGVTALFKGYLATWLKIGPFTLAQFLVWDYMRSLRYSDDDAVIANSDMPAEGRQQT